MREALGCLLPLVIACGSPTSGPSATPSTAASPETAATAPKAPAASAPEIVETREPEGDADLDCAAASPEAGLLDRTSTTFRRIEVTTGAQSISEKAFFAAGDAIVTARIGGCAHYGASYSFDYSSDHPIGDPAFHYRKALKMLAELPTRAGAENYIDGIAKGVEQALADPKLLETCVVPEGEMVNIHCGIDQPAPGRVGVAFAYDIVL